ncbi:TlpA family protein disulfide reductase [Micromonospora sp. NPDC049102]|uniref:TlpA family protein disulfide reductase n=1 Tax=Micromonospora sp. NPDC049102 TaxID=3364265 RepID=UPI00371C7CDC
MLFLIAAVILVGLVCVLDLVLTLGVIRRLREHTELLKAVENPSHDLTVGDAIDAFSIEDVEGRRLSADRLPAGTVVGFFSVGCQPCRAALPKFVDHAATMPGGRDQVVAVVAGADAADAESLVSALRPVARVVFGDYEGVLPTAFKIKGYPSVLMVDPLADGRLVVTDDNVDLSRAELVAAA